MAVTAAKCLPSTAIAAMVAMTFQPCVPMAKAFCFRTFRLLDFYSLSQKGYMQINTMYQGFKSLLLIRITILCY
jgi:hypothetical protein